VTTLNVNTIEPAGNTLTIGASGDSVVLADDVKSNTYKDAGGNTLFVSNGSGTLSSVNTGFGDALKLLSTQTASNSASLSFTSGIDSTYKEYIFKLYEIHARVDGGRPSFQASTDGGSNYNTTLTTTYFRTKHAEDDSSYALEYSPDQDQAQGTAFQEIIRNIGSDVDEAGAATLHLFNPASTTYVKHFFSRGTRYSGTWFGDEYMAGYFNTTSAINAVQFKMDTGNFDGTIKMWGVKN
jgi:hypothetical protein